MATPSEILRKTKKKGAKDTGDRAQTDKQGDDKRDEKMPDKTKRNALIDFIAKNKKVAA